MFETMRRSGRVQAAALLVLLAACAGGNEVGSSDGAEGQARALARLFIETGAVDRVLDNGAELAWGASLDTLTLQLGREASKQEHERGIATMRTVLAEFITPAVAEDAAVSVYAAHFSAEELQQLIDFYGSPVGRKSLGLEGQLADEIDAAMNLTLGGDRLDAFIGRLDEALAAEFPGLASGEGS